MSIADFPKVQKQFVPGSSGWTAADLDNREIRRLWDEGHYEIVEGVLSIMPPAVFRGGEGLSNLEFILRTHLKQRGITGRFATEVEIALSDLRVYRSDLALILESDERRMDSIHDASKHESWRDRPLILPPSLIVESISRGHEVHDRVTKRRAYAEFGVPNYWLLDAFSKSLECLVLDGNEYRTELLGKENDQLRSPRLFPDLVINLQEIWGK